MNPISLLTKRHEHVVELGWHFLCTSRAFISRAFIMVLFSICSKYLKYLFFPQLLKCEITFICRVVFASYPSVNIMMRLCMIERMSGKVRALPMYPELGWKRKVVSYFPDTLPETVLPVLAEFRRLSSICVVCSPHNHLTAKQDYRLAASNFFCFLSSVVITFSILLTTEKVFLAYSLF